MRQHEIELLLWGKWLVHVLSLPKFALSVEGNHVVEESAALMRGHVVEVNVWPAILRDCGKTLRQ